MSQPITYWLIDTCWLIDTTCQRLLTHACVSKLASDFGQVLGGNLSGCMFADMCSESRMQVQMDLANDADCPELQTTVLMASALAQVVMMTLC